MRIKVNPKEKTLTGDKIKVGGEVTVDYVKKVHTCAPLLRL